MIPVLICIFGIVICIPLILTARVYDKWHQDFLKRGGTAGILKERYKDTLKEKLDKVTLEKIVNK